MIGIQGIQFKNDTMQLINTNSCAYHWYKHIAACV
jgi:hypothetical protein